MTTHLTLHFKEMTTPIDNKRLAALDVMRGLTIAGMILVNNPGSWQHIFSPLRHAEWHGLTPTDLVFPFFMFIMGTSTALSLKRYGFSLNRFLTGKILRRTVIIFLLGLILDRIAAFCWGATGGGDGSWLAAAFSNTFDLSGIRIPGVLQRLAICYCITAFIGALLSRRAIGWIIIIFLSGYAAVLLMFDGLEFADSNIIGIIDRTIFGENHIYSHYANGLSLAFDPEGLLSTIPSIAHCLIGFLVGRMILSIRDLNLRMLNLFIGGTVMMFAGMLLSYGLPINKNIWSPTFVLTTCGMASSLLGLLIWVIDIKGQRRWSEPFRVFGLNPLFLYVLSGVLAIVLGVTAGDAPYRFLDLLFGNPKVASFVYALCFTAINWVVGYILYIRKIIVKI